MKTISYSTVSSVISLCLALSGCAFFRPSPADVLLESCRALELPKQGGTFKLGGLEVPFRPQRPIKIGTIDFSVKDAQRVSDEIYAMAELRRSQCTVISGALLGSPPPTGAQIIALQEGIDKVKKKSDDLVSVLKTPGATPKEALDKAQEAKAAADNEAAKARAEFKGPFASKVGVDDLSDELAAELTSFRKIGAIKAEVDQMQRQIADIKSATRFFQISVTGFETYGIALTAPMKDELSKQIESILRSAGPFSVPRIAVVGYADDTGVYLGNLDIGLQRATSVAAYLGRTFPQRAEITTISSGGVRHNDKNARRVDVLIS
ncbi:hypothetical protein [Acidovorax sp. NCPPB 4044]|uniref:hypothetical protein n=1 Tax=Acidovorax sp. NCPPB 4044 TaxID=2940490 RepID=UPI0023040F60|nr:hypothetical protein [Acidovorax sp. NCPPB 4044]MDA8522949.1 hypothetical protein [Acidovorax sp. NCPPB 4044]